MDSGSNLRAKAFLLLKILENSKKKKKNANRLKGDGFTSEPSMVILVFKN